MSTNILWKSFNICFSKFKCFPTITFPSPPTNLDEKDHNFAAATKPSTLFNNFNSLYDVNYSDITSTTKSLPSSSTTTLTGGGGAATEDFFSSEDDSDTDSVPDFTSAFASNRFFFSSPGSSNSIFEAPLEPPPPSTQDSGAVVSGGVAVQTDSPDPFSDFRKSMMEMIEARDLKDVKADWEFLHELLLCYLTLNPKHTHKFIIGAFADVVVSLVSPAPPIDAYRNTHLGKHCAPSQLSI